MNIASVKLQFFDSDAVMKAADRAKRKLLSRVGAYVRTRARSSLKYGTSTSRPGEPPVVHRSVGFSRKKKVGGALVSQPASPLRELLFFAYDSSADTVVIGPALGGSASGAPRALEHGGSSIAKHHGRTVTIRVGARPFVSPALASEAPRAIASLKDSL